MMRLERSRPWWTAVGVVVVLGYAWIAAALRPFTWPENVLVALPMIPVVLFAARRGQPDTSVRAPTRALGAVVWVLLVLAAAVWELAALFSSPRDDHPTLSSITDWIMSVHVGRAAVFVGWLVLGVALALRPWPRTGR